MSVLRLPRCYIIYILLTHPSPLCIQLTTCRDPSAVQLTGGGGIQMALRKFSFFSLRPTMSCFCFVFCFYVRTTSKHCCLLAQSLIWSGSEPCVPEVMLLTLKGSYTAEEHG